MAKKTDGKIYEGFISRFDGGEAENEWLAGSNQGLYVENFDLALNPEYLRPTVGFVKNGGSFDTTWGVRRGVVVGGDLWGLGRDSATGYQQIFQCDEPFGSSITWSEPASSIGNAGTPSYNMFTFYKDYLYFISGAKLNRYGTISSGNPTITNSYKSLTTYTDFTDGFVMEGILYWAWTDGTQTYVASLDSAGTLDETNFELPNDRVPVQLAKYGNFLGILCAPVNEGDNSYLYLWDRTSSFASEIVDCGSGNGVGVDNLEGALIIVIENTSQNTTGVTNPKSFLTVLRYTGGTPTVLYRITSLINYNDPSSPPFSWISTTTPLYNYRGNCYIGILFSKPADSVRYEIGLLRIGRKNINYSMSFSRDYQISPEDTNPQSVIDDFLFFKNSVLLLEKLDTYESNAHITNINTNQTTSYPTATYISKIIDGGSVSIEKPLDAVTVYFKPLLAGQSVVLKYRKDAEDDYTTLFTFSTEDKMFRNCINVESTAAPLPVFREINLMVQSIGGAEITGIKYKYKKYIDIYG